MSTRKPRRKKERGRPMKKSYPPRADATPEEMVRAIFALPPIHRKDECHGVLEGQKAFLCCWDNGFGNTKPSPDQEHPIDAAT